MLPRQYEKKKLLIFKKGAFPYLSIKIHGYYEETVIKLSRNCEKYKDRIRRYACLFLVLVKFKKFVVKWKRFLKTGAIKISKLK